ncbi:MAG TPA: HAD hydrolase-like protein [Methanomicrobiales archaeon]|nr:HAD hydrolase-like protein [Methanomicrobiales archaeon]
MLDQEGAGPDRPVFGGGSGIICVVILDFDGVVLESVGIKTRAFRELFSFRPDHVDEIVDYHSRNTGVSRFDKFRYIYREILKEPLSDELFDRLSEQYAGLVVEGVVASPFVPGGREFLERYSKEIPLFVVSASPQVELESIIARRELSPHFRKVYGAPTRKEQAIREIMAITGSGPEQTLFVGDALNDLKAAAASGVRFVGRQPPEDPDRFTGVPGVESAVRDLADLSVLVEREPC